MPPITILAEIYLPIVVQTLEGKKSCESMFSVYDSICYHSMHGFQ